MKEHQTVFSSAARTATTSQNLTIKSTGGIFVIDVTAVTATPSVVFTVDGICSLSGKAYNIITSAAKTGTGTTILRIFPAATASANVTVNDTLPQSVKVTATHADTDSITYSMQFIGTM